jgi:enoyl-[acyl-carrier protein] reductase I
MVDTAHFADCRHRAQAALPEGAMTHRRLDWKSNDGLAVGKGATLQEFFATAGNDKLVIAVAPWGEGHLKVNGHEVGHVENAANRRKAFSELKRMAERYLESRRQSAGP